MTELVLECQGLEKKYRKSERPALQEVHFQVPEGVCTGILGPNGSGKTTLVEICQGLKAPTSGRVLLLGQNPMTHPAVRKKVSGVLQCNGAWSKVKVCEALRLFESFYPAKEQVGIQELEKSFDLGGIQDNYVEKLSGGQRQKFFLALALLGNPEVLFLDEPTTGLDPKSRLEFWGILEKVRDQGRTIILTTHYLDEAERLCDSIIVLKSGRVIAKGSPNELKISAQKKTQAPHLQSLTEVYLALVSEGGFSIGSN